MKCLDAVSGVQKSDGSEDRVKLLGRERMISEWMSGNSSGDLSAVQKNDEVLHLCHVLLFADHMGMCLMPDCVIRGFHWYRIQCDVKLHIHVCPT